MQIRFQTVVVMLVLSVATWKLGRYHTLEPFRGNSSSVTIIRTSTCCSSSSLKKKKFLYCLVYKKKKKKVKVNNKCTLTHTGCDYIKCVWILSLTFQQCWRLHNDFCFDFCNVLGQRKLKGGKKDSRPSGMCKRCMWTFSSQSCQNRRLNMIISTKYKPFYHLSELSDRDNASLVLGDTAGLRFYSK